VINEKGEVVSKEEKKEEDMNSKLFNDRQNPATTGQKEQNQYTPIGQYKPTGNLIYNDEMFEKLEKKVTFQNG
jgi:hypothetical protein